MKSILKFIVNFTNNHILWFAMLYYLICGILLYIGQYWLLLGFYVTYSLIAMILESNFVYRFIGKNNKALPLYINAIICFSLPVVYVLLLYSMVKKKMMIVKI